MTRVSPRRTSIGEFSTRTNRGLTSPMIRAISRQSPLRSPSIPVPGPQIDISWQGNPPETTSTAPFQGCPSKVQTSSHTGNGGRCPSFCRCISRLAQKVLTSTAQTVLHPRSFAPSIPPPAPAKSANSFISPHLATGASTQATKVVETPASSSISSTTWKSAPHLGSLQSGSAQTIAAMPDWIMARAQSAHGYQGRYIRHPKVESPPLAAS